MWNINNANYILKSYIDKEQMLADRTIIEKKILNYMQQVNMQHRIDKTKKTHALDSIV